MRHLKRALLQGAILFVLAAAFAGCTCVIHTTHTDYAKPSPVYAKIAPPAAKAETRPQAPGAGWVWIQGHWEWNVSIETWVWVDGTWEQPPEDDAAWTEPEYQDNNGDWMYVPGYWHNQKPAADDGDQGVKATGPRDDLRPMGTLAGSGDQGSSGGGTPAVVETHKPNNAETAAHEAGAGGVTGNASPEAEQPSSAGTGAELPGVAGQGHGKPEPGEGADNGGEGKPHGDVEKPHGDKPHGKDKDDSEADKPHGKDKDDSEADKPHGDKQKQKDEGAAKDDSKAGKDKEHGQGKDDGDDDDKSPGKAGKKAKAKGPGPGKDVGKDAKDGNGPKLNVKNAGKSNAVQ
jgi:hypothetical protein